MRRGEAGKEGKRGEEERQAGRREGGKKKTTARHYWPNNYQRVAINLDAGCEEGEGKRGAKRKEDGRLRGEKGERRGGNDQRRNGSESWGRGEGREDEEQ